MSSQLEQPRQETLEVLLAEAEGFGSVSVFSSADKPLPNRYMVRIEFPTIAGITLEAKSGFKMPIKAAFREAIEMARMIRSQFK